MEYILASTNKHKVQELNDLLEDSPIIVVSSDDKMEVVEDGDSFRANALLKAKAYYDKYERPTLSDDSGLVVNAIPDQLGIYSARFAPDFPEYSDKCQKLIEILNPYDDKSAYFVCYLCFYKSPEEIYFFEGRVHGTIAETLSGDGGFGYDPVFLPEGRSGRSLAEESEWKMTNSHRAKACSQAVKFFRDTK
jgi:XTP/dITP diphosphohydrolase